MKYLDYIYWQHKISTNQLIQENKILKYLFHSTRFIVTKHTTYLMKGKNAQ